MDSVSPEKRSRMMSGIKGKNTKPEIIVRKYLYSKGLRYRLHRKDLAGKPDIVLSKYRAAIFVNGCYWHRHEGCKLAYNPKSNVEFWQNKFKGNVDRDKRNQKLLMDQGWRVVIVWECEVRDRSFEKWVISRVVENTP